MPPQSNPNWRHLEEYEQIKRKNRRRLVGALLLTTVVALLLAKVMGSSKNTAAPGEITVSGGSETAASMVVETQPLPEPVAEVPTGADTAVEMQPQPVSAPVVEPEAVVVEPAPPAPQPVQPASRWRRAPQCCPIRWPTPAMRLIRRRAARLHRRCGQIGRAHV